MVNFFIEGSVVDHSEESTPDLLVHDVRNSQIGLFECKVKVLLSVSFIHLRWLVFVEGCNSIVDQFPQGKHVLGFFTADFVFVFSSDPSSVNNS